MGKDLIRKDYFNLADECIDLLKAILNTKLNDVKKRKEIRQKLLDRLIIIKSGWV